MTGPIEAATTELTAWLRLAVPPGTVVLMGGSIPAIVKAIRVTGALAER
ncbi:hypothetical protein GA0070616_5145 [Micromonospora nigra]|uniref:Uncharacterized protein n=1 Tax=Micromonospora nigra TaxID=145857 RepID=A0A1C6T092_9ACTN|nr:hypothetical protein [Micromonospora nigra]SCL35127.1 hypothetical protein GA0070616_5145 [Micromonospora nigra]